MMAHTYTNQLSHKIKKALVLGLLASSLSVTANAADGGGLESEILLKEAVVDLYNRNKKLEARIELLEKNVFPQDSKGAKGSSTNPLKFEEVVRDNIQNNKLTFGRATRLLTVREKPSSTAAAVFTIAAGNKVIIKNSTHSHSGHLWYEIDEGLYVYSEYVTFWSDAR